jgi:hypothetical protein
MIIALALTTISSLASGQTVQRIDIVDFGIYAANRGETTATPGTAAGVTALTGLKLVRSTTSVPARIGTTFGFRYRFIGQPSGATLKIKKVTLYPQPGVRNPATENTTVRGEYFHHEKMGEDQIRVYTLDSEWELVKGTWTFELWLEDRKLASKSFDLVKP